MSNIKIIVAVANNNVIGKGNTIPWHLPTDMKFFKTMTENHVVVMGRKCWESLPPKFRPLPNRRNIIITRDTTFSVEGAEVYHDLKQLLEEFKNDGLNQNIYIIGGGEIYKQSFEYADYVLLTSVLLDIDGDVFFDGFDKDEWLLTFYSPWANENKISFRFNEYTKKSVYYLQNQN